MIAHPDIDIARVESIVRLALHEDFGDGDVTGDHCVPVDARSTARVITRENCLVAGLPVVETVFRLTDPSCVVTRVLDEGQSAPAGATLFRVSGPARALLRAERVSLNFLSRLCGIATITATYTRELDGLRTRLLDTRKTTPGLRYLEKYAVRVGGGTNHRFNLSDGAMIKENHIRAAGGITAAVKRLRPALAPGLPLEVEVTDLTELDEAIAAGADIIMLDNMSLAMTREAVTRNAGRAKLEASGNVTLKTLRDIAATGVDFVSTSATIRKASWIDLSMLFDR